MLLLFHCTFYLLSFAHVYICLIFVHTPGFQIKNILLLFMLYEWRYETFLIHCFYFSIIQEVAFPKNWGQVWRSLRIKTRLLCLPKPLQSKYEYPWAKNKLKFNCTWWPEMWLHVYKNKWCNVEIFDKLDVLENIYFVANNRKRRTICKSNLDVLLCYKL